MEWTEKKRRVKQMTEPQKKANLSYQKKRAQLKIWLSPEQKERIIHNAEAMNLTVTSYIIKAMDALAFSQQKPAHCPFCRHSSRSERWCCLFSYGDELKDWEDAAIMQPQFCPKCGKKLDTTNCDTELI
jgi:NADH pyrophosphatase NudC (nudix superfamily)